MSVYLDTSLVVALLTYESHSDGVQAWLYRHSAEDLLVIGGRWSK